MFSARLIGILSFEDRTGKHGTKASKAALRLLSLAVGLVAALPVPLNLRPALFST